MTTLDTATLFPSPESSHELNASDLERAWRTRDELIKQLHVLAEQLRTSYRHELDVLQEHTDRRHGIEHARHPKK